MPYTLFISDMHLQEEAPGLTRMFLQFLQTTAEQAETIYILGDCFETWVGDDDHSPFNLQIIKALRERVAAGTPIYFMHGNRDFLIGKAFAQASGITLLRDPSVIELYGKRILLSHGDILCTLDRKHQRYRKQVNRPWLQKLFLAFPLSWRQKIAHYLRQQSRRYNQTAPAVITDVSPDEVQRLMTLHQVLLLIHGHTHRPAVHEITIDEKTAHRVVLGAWHEAGSALLYHDDGRYELISFR